MALRSELLSINLPDSKGNSTTYYTYDGYCDENDRQRIRTYRRDIEQFHLTGASILGYAGFLASKRIHLPSIHFRGFTIPVSGLFAGAVSFLAADILIGFINSARVRSFENQILLGSKHLPLWSNKRYATNPDRAFFELADERHNEPLIFHSGLTSEAASLLIPDKILGTVPHKPNYPSAHDHDHGHEHH